MAKKLENMDDEEFASHIKKLDDDDFMDAWTEFGDKVRSDRERLLAFSREHQHRVRLEQLKNMGLTPADLELLQSLEPEAIESDEAVGEQPEDDTTDDEETE